MDFDASRKVGFKQHGYNPFSTLFQQQQCDVDSQPFIFAELSYFTVYDSAVVIWEKIGLNRCLQFLKPYEEVIPASLYSGHFPNSEPILLTVEDYYIVSVVQNEAVIVVQVYRCSFLELCLACCLKQG